MDIAADSSSAFVVIAAHCKKKIDDGGDNFKKWKNLGRQLIV